MTIKFTAKYFAPYKSVIINFMDDGSVNYSTSGNVSDEQVKSMISASGGNVEGFFSNES